MIQNRKSRQYQVVKAAAILIVSVLLTPLASLDGQGRAGVSVSTRTPTSRRIEKEQVKEAEFKLAELGYWAGKPDGLLDVATKNALIAFQKIQGLKRTGKLTEADLEVLDTATPPEPKASGFPHIEVDLTRQVLFFVSAEGKVSDILPISSGSGKPFTSEGWTRKAITPIGRFKVERKIRGWRKSPLGLLYYPNYILDGVAIHGNPFVPVVPASHGCIRIPMFAAKEFFDLTPVGTIVLVYGDNGATAGDRSIGKPADPFIDLPTQTSPVRQNPPSPENL